MSIATETSSQRKPDVLSFRQAMMPRKNPGFRGALIWAASLTFVLFQFFVQLSTGEIVGGLMNDFHLSAAGAGFLASAYYYMYVTLQTPAGILMDRYGPRLLLSVGAAVVSVGCFMFALAHWFVIAFIGRMIMGLGAAFAFVGVMYIADRWFPKERFSLLAGLTEMGGMLGTLIGVMWIASVVESVGWRQCMIVAAWVVGALAILMALIVRNTPANRRPLKAKRAKRRILPGLRVLMRIRVAWYNGLYCGLMFTVLTVFAALWCVPFLQVSHHYSLVRATFYTSLIYVGVGIFGPLIGILDNYLHHRRLLMMGSGVACCLLTTTVILWIAIPGWCLAVCMFLIGSTCASYVLTFTVANEIAVLRIRSASIGFVNTWCVGTAPIFQPLIGAVLVMLAKRDHAFDIAHYTTQEYQMALMLIPLCLVIAAWMGLYIPPARYKKVRD